MNDMRIIVLALVLTFLAACGNNRMHSEWNHTRDVLNTPFR